jgi:hypothetical protein
LRFDLRRTMLRRMKAIGKLLCLAVMASVVPLASSLVACGGGETNLPPPPPSGTGVVSSSTTTSATASATTPPQPVAPPPALILGAASDDPKPPLPTVKILAPTSGQVIPADKAADFVVKLDVKNWQTAMGSQHVHLILDNHPYKPIYDPKAPVKLSELMAGDPLNEGEHIIVAFPSRANHESVKTKDALTMLSFWVGKKGATATDLKKPMLVYSRPKGDYKGLQASHVIVDYQVSGVTLAEGKDHVHITVQGPGIADKLDAKAEKLGPPYFLDNLQNGVYTVKLELMTGSGADMKLIPGAWNSTVRSIRIDHDAQPDPMPMPTASTAASTTAAPSTTASAKKP